MTPYTFFVVQAIKIQSIVQGVSIFLWLQMVHIKIENQGCSGLEKNITTFMASSKDSHLPSKVLLIQRSSSIYGCLVYNRIKLVLWHLSSSKDSHLPSRVIFQQWSSSIKGCLPSKFVFHQRSASFKCCLPSKVVIHQKSSVI